MRAPDLLPLSALRIDASDSPDYLIGALASSSFVSGERPHARRGAIARRQWEPCGAPGHHGVVARGPDEPVDIPTPWRMVLRGMVGSCPLCGGRGLFTHWFTLAERCPTCGHRFERKPEEGFFLGAYTLNLSLVLTLLCIVLFAYGLATGDVIGIPAWTLVAAAVVIAVVVPLLGYPLSKTTWSAIDLAMNPQEPVEQAEAVAYVASLHHP